MSKSDTEPIVVVCASDDNYALPLGVTLYSLINKLDKGQRVEIFILSLGISTMSKGRLNRVLAKTDSAVNHTIIEIDEKLLSSLPTDSYLTLATYLRIFIPDLLPEHYYKAIYIDSDLLIGVNLRGLWDLDVSGQVLQAVRTFGASRVSDPGHVHNWRELGIPENAAYFNAGVLLINLDAWRARKLTPALIKYAVDNRELINYHDQGALNAVCYDCWAELDPTWNVTLNKTTNVDSWPPSPIRDTVKSRFDELWNRPSIYHYTTHWKPWTPGHRSHLQSEWFDALKKSDWFSQTEYTRWVLQWKILHYWRAISRKVLRSHIVDRAELAKPIRLWGASG